MEKVQKIHLYMWLKEKSLKHMRFYEIREESVYQ